MVVWIAIITEKEKNIQYYADPLIRFVKILVWESGFSSPCQLARAFYISLSNLLDFELVISPWKSSIIS